MTLLAHLGGALAAPAQAAGPLLLAVLYARRVRTLADGPRAVPAWRQACFFVAIVLIVVAIASPVAHVAGELFWVHMLEHLLIADIAALLLVLGLTAPVLAPVLRVRGLGWLRVLTHPLVALPLWAADLFVWHLPFLYEAAVRSPAVHALEHAMFVGFGVGAWMALLGPLPRPAWFGNLAKLLYILALRLLATVLANVLLWTHAIYPHYEEGAALWDLSAAQDQKIGAGLMMIEGSLVTLGLFAWLFIRSAREGEERQALMDLAGQRGVALDERRAARAVSAGRAAELRARILSGG